MARVEGRILVPLIVAAVVLAARVTPVLVAFPAEETPASPGTTAPEPTPTLIRTRCVYHQLVGVPAPC
jgi:hypothetical protein